jgi:hypothetical protein
VLRNPSFACQAEGFGCDISKLVPALRQPDKLSFTSNAPQQPAEKFSGGQAAAFWHSSCTEKWSCMSHLKIPTKGKVTFLRTVV